MTNSRSKPREPEKRPTTAAGGELPLVTAARIWNENLRQLPDEVKITLMEEIINDSFDGNAAAFSRHYGVNKGLVSRALNKGYIAPSISKAMGWPLKVEVPACPHCGDEAHTYDCQKQIVKPKPQPRLKRKRRIRVAADVNTEEQREALHKMASKRGLSYSEMIRGIADGEIRLLVVVGSKYYEDGE